MSPLHTFPDTKVHGANMGHIWGRQDPGGPHVGPMNFAIWVRQNISYWYSDNWPQADHFSLLRPSDARVRQ